VHRAVGQPCVQARHRCERDAHPPSLEVTQ
jgi:hypothetical protein